MPIRNRDDMALLLAAACVPLPEAMILMLCQPENRAPDLALDFVEDDPPVTDRQRWILNVTAAAGALAVFAAATVAKLAPHG